MLGEPLGYGLCVRISKKKRVFSQHLFFAYSDVLQLMQKFLLLVENRKIYIYKNSFQVWLIIFDQGTEVDGLSQQEFIWESMTGKHLSSSATVRWRFPILAWGEGCTFAVGRIACNLAGDVKFTSAQLHSCLLWPAPVRYTGRTGALAGVVATTHCCRQVW